METSDKDKNQPTNTDIAKQAAIETGKVIGKEIGGDVAGAIIGAGVVVGETDASTIAQGVRRQADNRNGGSPFSASGANGSGLKNGSGGTAGICGVNHSGIFDKGSNKIGIGGVNRSGAFTTFQEEERENLSGSEEAEVSAEPLQGEVVDSPHGGSDLLEEGFIDGEIVEEMEAIDGIKGLLTEGSIDTDDWIEGDYEDIKETEPVMALMPHDQGNENQLEQGGYVIEAEELELPGSGRYGLTEAEAFTSNESFDDIEQYSMGIDNDLQKDEEQFISNSFDDQGALAPFYPSEDLAFAGFSNPNDAEIEADFAFGGI